MLIVLTCILSKVEKILMKAYFKHNVKTFSLDTKDELIKIIKAQIMQKI